MPKLIVTTREGKVHELQGTAGHQVMEIIRDADLADPFAVCGGACACATCHVYVDAASIAAALPPASSDERDLLEFSDSRRPNSRLSCQIEFGPALDGLKVTIAPAE